MWYLFSSHDRFYHVIDHVMLLLGFDATLPDFSTIPWDPGDVYDPGVIYVHVPFFLKIPLFRRLLE